MYSAAVVEPTGQDPGHAAGFTWADLLAALVAVHGTLSAVAWRLVELAPGDDIASIERALRRLRSRGQQHRIAHAGAERLAQLEDTAFELQPLAAHLDQIYSNYVMDSQRNTHNSVAHGGSAEVKANPKVELF